MIKEQGETNAEQKTDVRCSHVNVQDGLGINKDATSSNLALSLISSLFCQTHF
jgi:hypothetical protein